MWPYGVGGATLAFGSLALAQWGEHEGGAAVVVPGLVRSVVGGLVVAWLGVLLVDKRR